MNVREALRWATHELLHAPSRTLNPRLDAEVLLLHALRLPLERAFLLANPEASVETAEPEFRRTVNERASGKPIQYITGHQEFWGLDFLVSPAVLIPRPETEHLVEAALEIVADKTNQKILDIGTGSGCIAISLAHSLGEADIVATDISGEALHVARANAQRHKANVSFVQSDLFAALNDAQYDLIVSNPPYISSARPQDVQEQVRLHEPDVALWAGIDGLAVYRRLIPETSRHLPPGGHLLLEIGHGMKDSLLSLFDPELWKQPTFLYDLQSIDRVVCAERR